MNKLIETILEKVPSEILTNDTLKSLIPGGADSLYGIIKRAIAKGDLIHIRRGLYIIGKKFQRRGINLFELAQKIYGPSYISLESALSYHGWIPEAVYTVTSACSARSKEFRTPLGEFSFTHIPARPLYSGIERVKTSESIYLMASPWKALLDYAYAYKKEWRKLEDISKDLRIEKESLVRSGPQLLHELGESYKSKRIAEFVDKIKKELAAK